MADESNAPPNSHDGATAPSDAADPTTSSTGLLMPGGEEFDATLVETLFMNELLALNDLVAGDDGAGRDVTNGFEGLAGLMGNSVAPAEAALGADGVAGSGNSLAPLPAVGEKTPPILPSSPVISGGSGAAAASALGSASEVMPGGIDDLSPLRPNRPHSSAAASNSAPAGAGSGTSGGDEEKAAAAQLVNQFATLAGKLGINLPPNVLSTLTAAAAANDTKGAASTESDRTSTPVGANNKSSTFAQQLQKTAEESIAAIEDRKRKASSSPDGFGGESSNTPTATPAVSSSPFPVGSAAAMETTDAAASSSSAAAAASAAYRRKKKPRLQDTESRLAALKAENETLKRHLANITDKTALIDQEREQAERKLSEMVKSGANEKQIGPVLARFGEMYSDYGRRRQEELTFHLNQLERLAAPTTITKMTLWTCGQSDQFFFKPKSNPIAGILMKELDITPVQGRKIVERRDKIREVCDNIRQCLVLMTKLKSLCQHKQKVFHDRMTKCQEILNPLQVAKLLVWVDNHADTLESVCPGWGSERMSKRSSSATKLPTLADDGKASDSAK